MTRALLDVMHAAPTVKSVATQAAPPNAATPEAEHAEASHS
jgi:hypothetical protein